MMHFAFGGLDLTVIEVAHDISFALGRNYFGTGDGEGDRGTLWTSSLRQYPILEIIGPIAAAGVMERGSNGLC